MGPPNIEANIINAMRERAPLSLPPECGRFAVTDKSSGTSTATANATINIASKSVLAWFTPSPIHTRIPERYARTNPAAVNAADIKYPHIQSSIAIMIADGGSGLRRLSNVMTMKDARAMSASFHDPHA